MSEGRAILYNARVPFLKPSTNRTNDGPAAAEGASNAAQVTAEDVSVGLKSAAATPALRLSCINTDGGEDEAESRKLPLLDIARTLGVDRCECDECSRSPVGSENAWIELLSAVSKNSVRESGEKRSKRGASWFPSQRRPRRIQGRCHLRRRPSVCVSFLEAVPCRAR